MHLHAGEQQQDARQERDVAHARDVGEETRVDVLRGVDVDDLRDAGRNLLQGDFVAAGHPDDRHHDHDDAREHRADQKSLRVMPEMADVPRRVTSVAHQYIAIENNPTYSPFCARAGTPIM